MVNPYKNTLLLIRRNQIMIYATTLVNPPPKGYRSQNRNPYVLCLITVCMKRIIEVKELWWLYKACSLFRFWDLSSFRITGMSYYYTHLTFLNTHTKKLDLYTLKRVILWHMNYNNKGVVKLNIVLWDRVKI